MSLLGSRWAILLADDNVPKGPEFGKASPVGLAVIVVLIVATVLLIRSMNRHVSNLPSSFDDPEPERSDQEADGPDEDTAGPDDQPGPKHL